MILSIVTSTSAISFAVVNENKLLGEKFLNNSRMLAETLVKELAEFLKSINITPKDLTAIGVCTGPGAFTGLRVGMTAAKIMSISLNIPVIGIDSLDIIANSIVIQGTFIVIQKACRNEVNAAVYGYNKLHLNKQTDNYVTTYNKLTEKLSINEGPIYICGDGAQELHKHLDTKTKKRVHLLPSSFSEPKASTAAFMAEIKHANKEHEEPLKLGPKYSHEPNIRKTTYVKNKNV